MSRTPRTQVVACCRLMLPTNRLALWRLMVLVCAAAAAAATLQGQSPGAESASRAREQRPLPGVRNQPLEVPSAVNQAVLRGGTVRVIIGLGVDFVPEGLLVAAERLRQRAELSAAQDALEATLAAFQARNIRRFRLIPGMAAEVDSAALAALLRRADVSYVELDALAAPSLVESTAIIRAAGAWNSGYTGAGQTVAILDTGVDSGHPFLGGRVVAEACFSTTQAGVSESVCVNRTGARAAAPCSVPACVHGTHVAGIAAGSGTASQGVAPAANIIAVQVFSRFIREAECGTGRAPCVLTFTSDQLLGLQHVYELRNSFSIAAANMSLGGGRFYTQADCDAQNTSRKTAIDNLRSAGIATVVASGNDGYADALSAPGCISSAISVGSTTDGSSADVSPADQVSGFTNTATFLNLLAPGDWIASSVPGGGFATYRGTSMAAPHVAGAWALLKSHTPTATVAQILGALTATGVPVRDSSNGVTTPRIDVQAAIASLTPACTFDVTPPAFNRIPAEGGSGTVIVTTQAGCGWSAASNAGFIAITPPASGQGAGSLTFRIATANPTSAPRSGTISIAGRVVEVTQIGADRPPLNDLDGDGRLDLLWHHQGTGQISAWLMDGVNLRDGRLLSPSQVPDTGWKLAGAGDLDRDGYVDLVWQNVSDGRLSVWLMNGLTRRETASLSLARVDDPQWRVRAVGDLDGDRHADLVWQHQTSGSIAVWRLNGLQVIEGTLLTPPQVDDRQWQIVGMGDFDRDGRRDLVWHHQTDGRVSVWFMNGTRLVSGSLTRPGQVADLNWRIGAVGDLNGDGGPDLIWQNIGTGQISAWLMRGLDVIEGRLLNPAQVTDTNWRIVGPR